MNFITNFLLRILTKFLVYEDGELANVASTIFNDTDRGISKLFGYQFPTTSTIGHPVPATPKKVQIGYRRKNVISFFFFSSPI